MSATVVMTRDENQSSDVFQDSNNDKHVDNVDEEEQEQEHEQEQAVGVGEDDDVKRTVKVIYQSLSSFVCA